jgi:hypothetical protein
MQLETVSKVKGTVAATFLALSILLGLAIGDDPVKAPLYPVAGVLLVIGVLVGISWIRQRSHMRRIEYAARKLQKG